MHYRVLAPLTLHSGLLGLTPEQAQARSFAIAAEGALWRVLKPVGFKAGELIEHDGEIPKALAQVVEVVEPAEAADHAAARTSPASKHHYPAKRKK